MKKLYNFFKVKLCLRTFWRQWSVFLVCMLIIILSNEYTDYTAKRVLEFEREKAEERLNLAKEKNSLKNIKN